MGLYAGSVKKPLSEIAGTNVVMRAGSVLMYREI
jgi:hypothetical protein